MLSVVTIPPNGGCADGFPPPSPLTFFRTTNSFSAVALRATSSSYLSVGEKGVRAEGQGLDTIPIPRQALPRVKGINSLQMRSCLLRGLCCALFMSPYANLAYPTPVLLPVG